MTITYVFQVILQYENHVYKRQFIHITGNQDLTKKKAKRLLINEYRKINYPVLIESEIDWIETKREG